MIFDRFEINLSGAEIQIFWENWVNSLVVDELEAFLSRS